MIRSPTMYTRISSTKIILEPILFLISVNDLGPIIHNPWSLFSENVKVAGIKQEQDTEAAKAWSRKKDPPLNLFRYYRMTSKNEDRISGTEEVMVACSANDLDQNASSPPNSAQLQ